MLRRVSQNNPVEDEEQQLPSVDILPCPHGLRLTVLVPWEVAAYFHCEIPNLISQFGREVDRRNGIENQSRHAAEYQQELAERASEHRRIGRLAARELRIRTAGGDLRWSIIKDIADRRFMPSSYVETLISQHNKRAKARHQSARGHRMLQLVSEGKTNTEIAEIFGLHPKYVGQLIGKIRKQKREDKS